MCFGHSRPPVSESVGQLGTGEYALKILVCPLSKVMNMIAIHAPERIGSLLDPNYLFPKTGPECSRLHLQLCFHDIHVATEG